MTAARRSTRIAALTRNEFRILRRDVGPVLILLAMPMVLTGFVQPAFKPILLAQGVASANGAEQAVPGMAVMFAFFATSFVGFSFIREHGWNTWDRLRTMGATSIDLILGKAIPGLAMATAQLCILFGSGRWIFGLRVRGSVVALGIVTLGLAIAVVMLGIALTSFCRSVQQLSGFATLGAVLLAGAGGAITPFATLPTPVQHVSPVTPSYWAMRGYRSVLLDSGGVGSVVLPAAVLLAFAVAAGVLTAMRFRIGERKVAWD